jgi:hypothetical protein
MSECLLWSKSLVSLLFYRFDVLLRNIKYIKSERRLPYACPQSRNPQSLQDCVASGLYRVCSYVYVYECAYGLCACVCFARDPVMRVSIYPKVSQSVKSHQILRPIARP